MRKINGMLLILILGGLTSGCVKPIEVEIDQVQSIFIVDGLITDKPGPYEVRISRSATYTYETEGTNYSVEGAIVTLYDDAGNAEILWEEGYGVYKTSEMKGVPGRSYHITIETITGEKIESVPEKLESPVEVDSVYYQFVDESPLSKAGHRVHLIINDPSETRNYYRWKWRGVYIFHIPSDGQSAGSTCWKYEYSEDFINISSDRLYNGNRVDMEIYKVPFFDVSNYLLTIEQYSLSPSAYDFWKLAREQIDNSGSVFDSPPSRFRGNLFHPEDPEKPVLGYFQASSLTEIPILINRKAENSNGYQSGFYKRSYDVRSWCFTLSDTRRFYSDPGTWPDGWEMD